MTERSTKASSVTTSLSSKSHQVNNPAVNKPTGVSSADVIRKLKDHFHPSTLFKPCLAEDTHRQSTANRFERRKRNRGKPELKMGHGGTLDPLATGVLIIGVLGGTKHLNGFLGQCSKTYEATVLFGAETDSHDRMGKIVRKRPCDHVTREMVEEALGKFRGKFMQHPPIFSALRHNGKRLYEYAREGQVPPVMPKPRPVEVFDLQLVDWYEPGTHEFRWPEEARQEEKDVAEKLLAVGDTLPVGAAQPEGTADVEGTSTKRKSPSPDTEQPSTKKQKTTDAQETETAPEPASTSAPATVPEPESSTSTTEPQPRPQPEQEQNQQPDPQTAPAAKIRMTVSSGFYVRVLANDLARAVNTSGHLSTLERTQQADFTLSPEKVLSYADLEAGEEVWGPKVRRFLEEWEVKQKGVVEALEREKEKENEEGRKRRYRGPGPGPGEARERRRGGGSPRRRRNSSSAEE